MAGIAFHAAGLAALLMKRSIRPPLAAVSLITAIESAMTVKLDVAVVNGSQLNPR